MAKKKASKRVARTGKARKATGKRPVGRPRKTAVEPKKTAKKAKRKYTRRVEAVEAAPKRKYTRRSTVIQFGGGKDKPFTDQELQEAQDFVGRARSDVKLTIASAMRDLPVNEWMKKTTIINGGKTVLNTKALAEALGVKWN